MTDNMIIICTVAAAVAVIAVPFIRRAVRYKKIARPAEPQPDTIAALEWEAQKEYKLRYLVAPSKPFRTTKTVRIRPAYSHQLHKVIRVLNRPEISIVRLVDNILKAHFEDNKTALWFSLDDMEDSNTNN